MARTKLIKFSIIIPFYNVKEEYLNECLNSAINQTYSNIEIILVNDGSTIKYSDLNLDSRIKVFNEKHNGVSWARNIGINNSSGDYIMFLDSDDMLCKNACELFYNTILDNPEVEVIFSRNYINDYKTLNFCSFSESKILDDKRELFNSIFIKDNKYFSSIDTPWAKLYKKGFLQKKKIYFNEKLTNGEDGIFNYEVLLNANNLYYLNYPTYIYRVNNDSVCNTFLKDLDVKFINLINEYEKLFKKYNIIDINFDLFVLRILDRLLRKFYMFLSKDEFDEKIYEYYDFFKKYCKGSYNELVDSYFKRSINSKK